MTPEKPWLFLLPGMLCDAEVWREQIPALQRHFHLHVPVFREYDDFVAMARSVLAHRANKFSLVAHSMGGRVAMELLRLAPGRIEQVVLMDMGVHPVAEGENERNQKLLLLAETGGLAAVADSWIPLMIHPRRQNDSLLVERIRTMVLRHDVKVLNKQLLAAQHRADQRQYLQGISHHIHILCGDNDNWNPPELHQRMHVQLRNSDLVILDECGHMAPMEQPEAVNQHLVNWLCK